MSNEKSRMVHIAVVQQQATNTVADNLQLALDAITQAAKQGAQLILLQELFATPYFCQTEEQVNFQWAESLDGDTVKTIQNGAKNNNVVIVAPIFERRAPGIYHNTAVVIESNGDIAGIYRKMHIPDDPGFYEKYYFTPGDLGFKPIQTSVGKLGVLICWDQWFPEAARLMALAGAELLLYPTAIGWDPRDPEDIKNQQLEAWQTIQQSHSIANGLPVVVCNRVGFEPDPSGQTEGINFWGNSFMTGVQGEILTQGNGNDPTTLLHSIDLSQIETIRQQWPYLRDRRIDAYGPILNRFIEE